MLDFPVSLVWLLIASIGSSRCAWGTRLPISIPIIFIFMQFTAKATPNNRLALPQLRNPRSATGFNVLVTSKTTAKGPFTPSYSRRKSEKDQRTNSRLQRKFSFLRSRSLGIKCLNYKISVFQGPRKITVLPRVCTLTGWLTKTTPTGAITPASGNTTKPEVLPVTTSCVFPCIKVGSAKSWIGQCVNWKILSKHQPQINPSFSQKLKSKIGPKT